MVNENMPELPLKIEKASISDWLYAVEVVVEYWEEYKDLPDFCLVSFLNTLSARLEIAADEFQKQDPDPIDQRHPVLLTPKCEYGMILKGFEKCNTFIACLVEDFIKDETTVVKCDGVNVSVASATCRFLLVAYTLVETLNSETIIELSDLLYGYAMNKDDPISTYAIGILSKQSDQMCLSSKCDKSSENKIMVRNILRRLWKLVNPEGNSQQKLLKKPESSTSTSDVGCSKDIDIPCDSDKTKSTKLVQILPSTNSSAKKGRKRSAPQPEETKTRMKLRRSQQEPDARNAYVNRLSSSASTFEISMPSINDMPEANFSSSSWKEMRPIVVGLRFSLKPPLSSKVQQLYLLDWLSPLAEYQDVLSIFIEQNALDLVLWYLKRSATNNGLITYAAMRLLSGLLCHHKITIVFIEKKGIEKLLRVPRPSIGATGGALILYYLSYHKEAMALMAGLGNKIIQEMINYGVWLLESSHDSGRCHSALFFLYAFSYQTVMKVFDARNGIRYLINMIGTLPIMNPDPEASDQRTEEMSNFSCRQVTKTACTTLKKYFETHLKMEFGAATALASGKNEWPFDQTKPVEIDGRTELLAHLDYLRFSDKRQGRFEIAEKSIRAFIKFDGIRLLLKVIMLAKTWACNNRSDIIRSALDCLAIVTLSSAAWPLLLQPVLTGDLPNEKETGLWLILSLVETNKEDSRADVQKSALAIIINCVCDPRLMKYRNGVDPSLTPPLDAVPTSLNDSIESSTSTKNKGATMEDLKLAWKIVKYQNGIQILLGVMNDQAHSAVDADDFRLLACQALCGLSCCDSIKQIMSKLPFFNSGQIQALVQKPVLQNNQTIAQHARFRTFIRMLVERLSGKLYSKLNLDLESQRKEHIVTQTPIRFNNHELLQVIHKHLKWSGLDKTADLLAKEALLPIQQSSHLADGSSSVTPSSSQTCESGGGTPNKNRISFTRGSKAQGKLPLLEKAAFAKKSNKMESSPPAGSAKAAAFKIPPKGAFLLSSNGTISTRRRRYDSSGDSTDHHETPSPVRSEEVTLNHIITDYLRTQHASCSDPVVTVPEFSLFRSHRCPTPSYRTEAPRNAARRNFHRQINPRHGGPFGQQYDRQLIYGKMKPCMTLHSGDNDTVASWRSEDVSYTACTFSSDDMSMILGNWQGDIIVRSIQGDEDHVVVKAMDFGAYGLECSRDGSTLLGFGVNGYSSYCQLFNMGPHGSDSVSSRWILEGPTYMEFAKTVQDKVVGTKSLKAKIYDLKTGQMTQVLTNENLTSHYRDNRATFSYDDWLVLNDGLLWDLRAAQKPIHKFDKFNNIISGVFHPQNLEIIINTEVWDMRSFHLLHTVPALDKRHLRFNNDGSVAYAADLIKRSPTYMERRDIPTTLTVIDGYNYTTLNMIDTRHDITDFACDRRDYYVATIENKHDHDPETRRVCRLYELGRTKDKDDDDEEEDDEDGENSLDDDEEEDDDDEDDFDFSDSDGDDEDSDGDDDDEERYVMHNDSSGLSSDENDDDAGYQDSEFSGEWSPATMDDSDGDAMMTLGEDY